ncbi:hypothetical protein [Burkholderia cepacia]|uniref:hypothetical protein n=1 Tax=Burkholderia cepacia TaxID=292 RepID=UPI0015892A8F|nr:hypothetical protein [Burkholderia cepacia]
MTNSPVNSSTNARNSAGSKKFIRAPMNPGDNPFLNACVGTNTGSSDNSYGYAEGFRTAAELMLKILGVARPAATDDNWGADLLLDTLVYPICYSARHHVELALKRALPQAWAIFTMRSPNNPQGLSKPRKNEVTHSVLGVWSLLDAICSKVGDDRLSILVKDLEPFVEGIDEIDSSGQTFRYASNADDATLHLRHTSHINLQHFADDYAEMCKLLEELELHLNALIVEYSMGSFTSKLNREQLVEIAKRLPPRSLWNTPAFKEAKAEIMGSYQLTSNDFQRACDMLQEKRALSHLIGAPAPIAGLRKDTFERLRSVSMTRSEKDSTALSLDERSALFGLLQVGSPAIYPEQFESFLGPRPMDEDRAAQFDVERAPDYLARRVSSRPDLVEHGLSVLGQTDLLIEFREVYGEEIDALRAAREAPRDYDFGEIFRRLKPANKGAQQ